MTRPSSAPAGPARRPLTGPASEVGASGTMHGDLSDIHDTGGLNGFVYLGVLAVAAGIDIATFYQVLALVMRNVPDAVVWLGVVGFTVTALALAHTMGVRLREQADRNKVAFSSGSAWLCLIIWLFVGVTAFIVRLVAAAPSSGSGTTIVIDGQPVATQTSSSDKPLLAALLFLALYLATGTVAALAGYLRHNNAAKRYAVATKANDDARRTAALTFADETLAKQTRGALDQEWARREEAWTQAQARWTAVSKRLKQEVRLRLAAAAQNPSTTDSYFRPPVEGATTARAPLPEATPQHAAPDSWAPQSLHALPPAPRTSPDGATAADPATGATVGAAQPVPPPPPMPAAPPPPPPPYSGSGYPPPSYTPPPTRSWPTRPGGQEGSN